MIIYDKNEIRDILTEEQIFELLEEFGGQPEHNSNNYIISDKLDIAYLRLKNQLKLDNNTNNYLDKCYKVIKSNVVATIKSINI